MGENAALQIGVELVFDELRQALYFGSKALIVRAHQPVERRLFGTAAFLARCASGRFAQVGCAHGWIGWRVCILILYTAVTLIPALAALKLESM